MKQSLLDILDALSNVTSGVAAAAVLGARAVLQQVDLPDQHQDWHKVSRVLADTITDITESRRLTDEPVEQIRLAAEHRATRQLHQLGLLEGV